MTSNELLNNGKLVRVSVGLNIETLDGRIFWSQQVRGKGVSFSAVNRKKLTLMAVRDACGNVITALRKILHHKDAQGRGVILLSMHLSSLDFCGAVLADHIPFDIMYRRNKNKLRPTTSYGTDRTRTMAVNIVVAGATETEACR